MLPVSTGLLPVFTGLLPVSTGSLSVSASYLSAMCRSVMLDGWQVEGGCVRCVQALPYMCLFAPYNPTHLAHYLQTFDNQFVVMADRAPLPAMNATSTAMRRTYGSIPSRSTEIFCHMKAIVTIISYICTSISSKLAQPIIVLVRRQVIAIGIGCLPRLICPRQVRNLPSP